jgi:hypothetical protein
MNIIGTIVRILIPKYKAIVLNYEDRGIFITPVKKTSKEYILPNGDTFIAKGSEMFHKENAYGVGTDYVLLLEKHPSPLVIQVPNSPEELPSLGGIKIDAAMLSAAIKSRIALNFLRGEKMDFKTIIIAILGMAVIVLAFK